MTKFKLHGMFDLTVRAEHTLKELNINTKQELYFALIPPVGMVYAVNKRSKYGPHRVSLGQRTREEILEFKALITAEFDTLSLTCEHVSKKLGKLYVCKKCCRSSF